MRMARRYLGPERNLPSEKSRALSTASQEIHPEGVLRVMLTRASRVEEAVNAAVVRQWNISSRSLPPTMQTIKGRVGSFKRIR